MRAFSTIILILCLSVASQPAAAQGKEGIAERLHKRAKELAKQGKLGDAIQLWGDAERLMPTGKYAFNLCFAYALNKQLVEAWQSCDRARVRSVSDKLGPKLKSLVAQLEEKLLQEYAYIELHVEPKNAWAELNGKRWDAPRRQWTIATESLISVGLAQYTTYEQGWQHPVGKRTKLTVSLQAKKALGALLVEGGPRGATVRVGGKVVGTLPLKPITKLKPGTYTVEVEKGGHKMSRLKVDVVASESPTRVSIVLKPLKTLVVKKPAPKPLEKPAPSSMGAVLKWSSLGGGAAALAAGIGMLVWADSLAVGAQDELGDNVRETFDGVENEYTAYADDYDDRQSRWKTAQITGFVLTGVGAALVATGAVLWAMEGGDEAATQSEPRAGILPLPLNCGGGVQAVVRF